MDQLRLIATCAFGLEAIVKRELMALGFENPKVVTPGRVAFQGDWKAICLANLWLRTADRVLIEAIRFQAKDFDALFETVKSFDWTTLLPKDASFPVVGKSRNSQLTSVPAIQRTVKKALVEGMRSTYGLETVPETGAEYKTEIALLNDEATVSIDTTGRSLHKRGYRKLVGEAPLKETLAAAMVLLSVWKPSRMLVDPFCGSGTIPIEAALIGRNIAPGLHRNFTCSDWPQIAPSVWTELREQAEQQIDRDVDLQIIGTDRDPEVLSLARYHSKVANVENDIHFQQKDFDQLRSKHEYGCVICNPPYGERLEERRRLQGLYERFPAVLQRLPTWSHFVITNMPGFEKTLEVKATRRRKLYNGRIECTYYQFLGPRPPKPDVAARSSGDKPNSETRSDQSKPSEPAASAPVFGGLEPKDHEQATLFESRLIKRAKHLRRWPTKRGITCFRLYERDIPELPFVVDRYEDCLHITEYERPHDRSAGRHASWLELMKKTAGKALDVPIQRVFMKTRLKSKGNQYHKIGDSQKRFTVEEDGLKFLVNLSDYVDTGLFLDHRNTRKMVRDVAHGKHFLNLFAYTGSFSVYAAAGGAATTTTVDWSRTYLDWAQDNLALNRFEGNDHQCIACDAMEFLESNRQTFDLAVVDPPTYSNRKGVEEDWDVQTQHAELLNRLAERLSPGAWVYFSTNFRRFKLDEASLNRYSIREISQQTVPEDFRNRRIHRCWLLQLGD